MIDYLRPVATATAETAAPPYEVLFQSGSDGKHKLSYVNGAVDPHYAFFRAADRVNGNPLINALEVILGGLPEDVKKVSVRAKSDACKEELKRECHGLQTKSIVGKTVTFHI
jgi:hypothetical protein